MKKRFQYDRQLEQVRVMQVIVKILKPITKGALILLLCTSYFLYLCLMFHSGTVGDSKAGIHGSSTQAIKIEGVAIEFLFFILLEIAILLVCFGRAHWKTKIITMPFIIPPIAIVLFILGLEFISMGITQTF